MSIHDEKTTLLNTNLTEVSELLEEMIFELEIRGYQSHHQLIKRALNMQKKLENLAHTA